MAGEKEILIKSLN